MAVSLSSFKTVLCAKFLRSVYSPAFFINAAISTCVIFSPKDLIINASSFSVIMPSLSPSNREKHSLNSAEHQKQKT